MTAPRVPSTLRNSEKAAWRALVAEIGTEVLEPSDTPLLRSLAILTARLDDLREYLARQSGPKGSLEYLMTETVRGVTGNPLLGHERETIKEIRLLHERLQRVASERGAGRNDGPKTLSQMRANLHAVKGGSKKAAGS